MHEFIEKIAVHVPDKSSGHRTQVIEIHWRFNVAVTTTVADSREYDKKRKAVLDFRQSFRKIRLMLYGIPSKTGGTCYLLRYSCYEAISFFVYLANAAAAPIAAIITPMTISFTSSFASEIMLLASA